MIDSKKLGSVSTHVNDNKVPGVGHQSSNELKPLAIEGEQLPKNDGEISPSESTSIESHGKASPDTAASFSDTLPAGGEATSMLEIAKEQRDLPANEAQVEHHNNSFAKHNGNQETASESLCQQNESVDESVVDVKESARETAPVTDKDCSLTDDLVECSNQIMENGQPTEQNESISAPKKGDAKESTRHPASAEEKQVFEDIIEGTQQHPEGDFHLAESQSEKTETIAEPVQDHEKEFASETEQDMVEPTRHHPETDSHATGLTIANAEPSVELASDDVKETLTLKSCPISEPPDGRMHESTPDAKELEGNNLPETKSPTSGAMIVNSEPTFNSVHEGVNLSVQGPAPIADQVTPSSEGLKQQGLKEKVQLSIKDTEGPYESAPATEGAPKAESDEGTEELYSPRPNDEEQPFVSEQDETQTIIGEGSLLGDHDISDITSNADSMPCSPRSTIDETAADSQSVPVEGSSETTSMQPRNHDVESIVPAPCSTISIVEEVRIREPPVASECNSAVPAGIDEPVEKLVLVESHEPQEQIAELVTIAEVSEQDSIAFTQPLQETAVDLLANNPNVEMVNEDAHAPAAVDADCQPLAEELQGKEADLSDNSGMLKKKEARTSKRLFGWCNVL